MPSRATEQCAKGGPKNVFPGVCTRANTNEKCRSGSKLASLPEHRHLTYLGGGAGRNGGDVVGGMVGYGAATHTSLLLTGCLQLMCGGRGFMKKYIQMTRKVSMARSGGSHTFSMALP